MIDFYTDTITIFNCIPANLELKRNVLYGFKTIIKKSKIDITYVSQTNQNTSRIMIKEIDRYLRPTWEHDGYYGIPMSDKEKYFTLSKGDFVVFGEVPDVCVNKTNATEFNLIKNKYALNGMTIANATPYIRGVASDHIEGGG